MRARLPGHIATHGNLVATPAYTRLRPPTPAYARLRPPTPADARIRPHTPAYARLRPPTPAYAARADCTLEAAPEAALTEPAFYRTRS